MSKAVSKRKILIAPLNWGLGHATRCMPIIDELLKRDVDVLLASDGGALQLLQKEYPQLRTFALPSYHITYSSSNMIYNMLWQAPKIWNAMRKEKQAITDIVNREAIDCIISDNRYGCNHPDTYNVFMTHQLHIKSPLQWTEGFINAWNHKRIRKFNWCWVPDFEGSDNLSGELSHPRLIKNLSYVGSLSRLKASSSDEITYELLIILSGPEPQRTILEKSILDQLENSTLPALVVRGRMDDESRKKITEHLEVVGFLTSKEINATAAKSRYIISRSGYSTIMDLAVLGKPAILIPTPGQTEQEYLANRFHEEKVFVCHQQSDLNLKIALEQIVNFTGFKSMTQSTNILQLAVDQLLEKL